LSVSIELGIAGLTDAEEIGRGGFGIVYRARQTAVGRSVAVKMLSAVSLSDDTRRRFERESQAMAAVSDHPNIVTLHDSGFSGTGRPYLVMELVPGGAMADLLPVPWARAVEVGVKVAGALETAHRAGIFHRDVKPENILLSSYGEPKLTDFGIAKVAGSSETPSANITASLLHAAPETLSGARPTASTDVYSLASTLYTLVAGRAPFAAEHDEETLAPLLTRISTAPVPDLRPAGVPDAVCVVLERALAKRPAERPATPAEFGNLLREAQRSLQLVPTDMLIEGVDREPAVRGVAEVTRRGVAVPAQREAAGSAPTRPRARRRMAWTAGAATAATAAAAVVVAVVVTGGDGQTPTGTSTGPTDHSTSYVFAAAADRTVRATRTWTVDTSGKELTNTTTVRNLTDAAVTRTAIEVIPKELAADVSDVELRPGYDVMQRDPIVRYQLRIAPGATATVTWSVRVDEVATDQFLAQAARSQKREQRRTADRMTALAKRFGFSARAVVPFATEKADPGVTDVGDKPGRTTASPTPGGDLVTPSAGGSSSPAGEPTTNPPRAVNHAPTLGGVADRTVSELAGVGISLDGSDADGDALSYSARGLPAGLSVSGSRITGTVSHAAVTRTTRDSAIQSRSFTVTVTVSDGHKSASRTFGITVRDTHRTMPNYVGKYGCGSCEPGGLPDIADLLTPTFKCHVSQSAEPDTVYSQSIPAGSVIRWGAAAVITYNQTSCP
jgi:hypothetical protein